MKKRMISLLMLLCLLLSMLPVTGLADDLEKTGSCGENLTWSISEDGMLTISGDGEMHDYLEQEPYGAPWSQYCKQITGIIVTEGVTTIGDYAFSYCSNAVSVSLPKSLTAIGKGAFMDCWSLASAEVPEGVVSIEESTFAFCYDMKSVILPEGLKTIGEWAFTQCYRLEEIILPESLEAIAEGAFYFTAFPEIRIPARVTELDRTAFEDNTDLRHIWVDEANPNFSSDDSGILFNKDMTKLLLCPQGFEGSYQIPNSVVEIADAAFAYCDELEGVTVPGTVVNMGKETFLGCYSLENVTLEEGIATITEGAFADCNLKEITIPASVTELDRTAFEFNENLKRFWVDEANPNFSADDSGILFNKDKTKLLLCPNGFEGSYTIPSSVTEIADAAFAYCDSLKNITIPGTVANMGKRAFDSCYSLKKVTLEEGITAIPEEAFLFCSRLEEINIPAGVTVIGADAFGGCYTLVNIYFEGDAPTIHERAFAGVSAAAFYPLLNDTYTEVFRQHYGGWIIWQALCPGHTYTDERDVDCDICGVVRTLHLSAPMYRLYNPNTGEHFYTGSFEERENLVAVGWNYEGVAWNAPTGVGLPVYRLFNPNNGDHHYTMSTEERDNLVAVGWNYEGVAWNSEFTSDLPLYRLYNPNAECGSHHYTGSVEERDNLVAVGWIYEGIGWFGRRW